MHTPPITRREAIQLMGLAAAGTAAANVSAATGAPAATEVAYDLQQTLPIMLPESITVIGVGRYGSWIAYFSALAGVRTIDLWDPAIVGPEDLSATPYLARHVGRPKVEAMQEIIAAIRPAAKVLSTGSFFELERDAAKLHGTVFDSASDEKVRGMDVVANKRGLKYITGAYSGMSFGAFDYAPAALKVESGRHTAVWMGSAAMSALLSVHGAFVSPLNFFGDISGIPSGKQAGEANLLSVQYADK
jgi:hypothetical protein